MTKIASNEIHHILHPRLQHKAAKLPPYVAYYTSSLRAPTSKPESRKLRVDTSTTHFFWQTALEQSSIFHSLLWEFFEKFTKKIVFDLSEISEGH